MFGLIDTNLFKKLTKNADGIHEHFVNALGTEAESTDWVVTPFGHLEYLGLALRGNVQVGTVPQGWSVPESARVEYRKVLDALGEEYVTYTFWIRSTAKAEYAKQLTDAVLKAKAEEDEKYHSQPFTTGPFAAPLFQAPLANYSAEMITELLSIDYLHRYHDYPQSMITTVRTIHRTTILAEYYVERRNIALVRGFKQVWNARTKGNHESHVAAATMSRLERAMSRLKNDGDRFDHDLLAYFLLGFATEGNYEPVTIYTQDDPDETLCRLAIFYSIIAFTWEEWKHLEGMGPLPFQTASRFRFVSNNGQIVSEIRFRDLTQFLIDEGLIVRKGES